MLKEIKDKINKKLFYFYPFSRFDKIPTVILPKLMCRSRTIAIKMSKYLRSIHEQNGK